MPDETQNPVGPDKGQLEDQHRPYESEPPTPLERINFTRRQGEKSQCFKHCPRWLKRVVFTQITVFRLLNRLVYAYSFLIAALAVLCTIICDRYDYTSDMPWSFVSIAIVFPITFAIGNSINRRDAALREFAQLRCAAFAIFVGFKSWGGNNRKLERSEHALIGRDLLYTFLDHFVDFFTDGGDSAHSSSVRPIHEAIASIGEAVEDLRLPPATVAAGQVHRLQQYVYQMQTCFERMKHLKEYRTPPPLRAFSYLAILLFPLLFGVYFAHMAKQVNLTFAILCAVAASFIVTALLNVSDHAECLFDQNDKANEFIDIAHPVGVIKAAMKVAGDPNLESTTKMEEGAAKKSD